MARPKDTFQRSCLDCIVTNLRHQKPGAHYAKGLCEKHYRQQQRKMDKCNAARCGTRLKVGQSRQGFCRTHEPLLLKEPIRTPEAIARTLERFVAQISPSRTELDGLFGCWPWQGRINKSTVSPSGEVRPGYGLISIGNHDWLAHRFSYANFIGGHRPGLTLDHVCRNSLCVRPDHLMPMTQRRNSELEHRRASDEPDVVLEDLLKLPHMQVGFSAWAMLKGLPIGRATPGGVPFAYGLDGEPFEHPLGPAGFPRIADLYRTHGRR